MNASKKFHRKVGRCSRTVHTFVTVAICLVACAVSRAAIDDILGDRYNALTTPQAAAYIKAFAADYASHYDQATAQKIKTEFLEDDAPNTEDSRNGITLGVARAFGFCAKVLSQHPPEKTSMKKVLSKLVEMEYGPPPDVDDKKDEQKIHKK